MVLLFLHTKCSYFVPELLSLLLDSSLREKLRCAGSWLGEMGGLISLLEVFPMVKDDVTNIYFLLDAQNEVTKNKHKGRPQE